MFRLCLLACLILGAACQSITYYMCSTSYADIYAGQSFTLRSPNYGANYMDNQDCSIQLRAGYEPLVLNLRYNTFSVEYASYCNYDRLCANGVEFCGAWMGGRTFSYIVPAYQTFTLKFHSDVSVTDTGFDVTVSTQSAYNATVNEASSGVGSQAGNVNYVYKSYYSGYPYSDRCSSPTFNTTTTSYPYYNTTYYPYYNTTGYPNYNSTYYPYYNTTSYPYNYTTYPYYYNTTYPNNYTTYPDYNTTWYYPTTTPYYPYYNTTYPPSNGTSEAQRLITDAMNLLQRALDLLRYGF